MKSKILQFNEKKKFINENDVGENIKFILNGGELVIRSTSLQCLDRILELDKLQIKKLIKFLEEGIK